MKKFILLFITLTFVLSWPSPVDALSTIDRLKGRFLLRVEQSGEIWYVIPATGRRVYFKDGQTTFSYMRNFIVGLTLGISDLDISKIPVGFDARFKYQDSDNDGLYDKLEGALGTNPNNIDSDGDGYDDGQELKSDYSPLGVEKLKYDQKLIKRLAGMILIQADHNGEIWYVNPSDNKRYYMPDGDTAYQLMKYLSLGITDNDLKKVPSYLVGYNSGVGSWNQHFGKTLDLDNIRVNIPSGIKLIPRTQLKEYWMTAAEYEKIRLSSDCEKYYYYCTELQEGKWVKQPKNGTVWFLLDNGKVYRGGNPVAPLTLTKKISDTFYLSLELRNVVMDNGQAVTAFDLHTLGGADTLTGTISHEQVIAYYKIMFNDLGLDVGPLADVKLYSVSNPPAVFTGNAMVPIKF